MFRKALSYPRAFWVLMGGFFINRISASLIWPFLTLVIYQQTGAPLTTVTLLISIQSVSGLLATSIFGSVMDRFGRKIPMIGSLLASAGVLLAMSASDQIWQWAILIALYGALSPVFYVGTYAMVADLVEPEERTNAYALQRMVANAAIALGPALGGIFLASSNALSYYTTATANIVLAGFSIFLLIETLPKHKRKNEDTTPEKSGGYGVMLRDRRFMTFIGMFILIEIATALTFTLLSVYTNENFGIPKHEFGWLLTINAVMVVALQFAMTHLTRRFNPFLVLAAGALFYTGGLLVFGLSSLLPHFAVGMVVLTIGELIVSPTATGLAANMAPPEMRARYMGTLSLTYTIGAGIGPVIGGVLSDSIAPQAIWYGGALTALIAAVGFTLMQRARSGEPSAVSFQPSASAE